MYTTVQLIINQQVYLTPITWSTRYYRRTNHMLSKYIKLCYFCNAVFTVWPPIPYLFSPYCRLFLTYSLAFWMWPGDFGFFLYFNPPLNLKEVERYQCVHTTKNIPSTWLLFTFIYPVIITFYFNYIYWKSYKFFNVFQSFNQQKIHYTNLKKIWVNLIFIWFKLKIIIV